MQFLSHANYERTPSYFWTQQRKNYKLLKVGKQSSLTTERTIRLSDVGFIFDAAGHRRMRKFEADSDEKEAQGFSSAIAGIEL